MPYRFAWSRVALGLGPLLVVLAAAGGCGPDTPSLATGPQPGDSTGVPVDSVPDTPPPDTTPTPPDTTPAPPDTTPAPPDSSVTPPDTTATPPEPNPPGTPPIHVGLAFGPAQQPATTWEPGTGATVFPAQPESLLDQLETARRLNLRLYISFSGSAPYNRDANGFSLALWKRRVDRFRGLPLQSYIDDGTIAGHFLLDEADDKSNWNGKIVPVELVEEMAKYSKSIWPTMPAIIRAFPDYLAGYAGKYVYLDAVRVQYHARYGDIDQFLGTTARRLKDLGLVMNGGLNVLRGGGEESGWLNPSSKDDKRPKYYMNAAQLRAWGKRFLAEPGLCGLILWEYDSTYFANADIRAALGDLERQARAVPNRSCRK
jgi:hypothetical protein